MDDADFGWDKKSGDPQVYPGGIVCYRYWRITEGGKLKAVAQDSRWTPENNEAVCVPSGRPSVHLAPQQGCKCGFYGWYTVEEAKLNHGNSQIGLGAQGPFSHTGSPLVLGAVFLSGQFVPGTLGMRAQYAKPLAIILTQRQLENIKPEIFSAFKKYYEKLEIFSTVSEMVAKFPPEDVPWAEKKSYSPNVLWAGNRIAGGDRELLYNIREVIQHHREASVQFVMSFTTYFYLTTASKFSVFETVENEDHTLFGIPILFDMSTEGIRLEKADG